MSIVSATTRGAAVHERFGDVFTGDAVGAGEIGDRARDAHDAVERSRAERAP